jgi:hypothetical protein
MKISNYNWHIIRTRYKGRLKFFDESKQYGFIVMDTDKSDIFVHYDDLNKANITKVFNIYLWKGTIKKY